MPINIVVLLVAIAAAAAVGFFWNRYNGHFRGAATPANAAAAQMRDTIATEDMPEPLGETATLLQFSSAFCAPCRATRRVLGDVASMVPGVRHMELDAEHHLDLVRRLGVMRTPTTFVLDRDGRIVTRASGQPRPVDVIAAIGRASQ
ncbi:MAG: thioredoxin family protein [Nocardioidaceae bacterium]